jgi:chromosome segregation ATPase
MILKYNDQGQPYEDPIEENKKLKERVKVLENSIKTALQINDNYQRDNKKLTDRAQEAEGEVTIVKGIGMNSPEMRAAQARIKELEGKCREAGRVMIELNAKYEMSIKEIDRLSEENTNIKTMKDDGNNTSNSC